MLQNVIINSKCYYSSGTVMCHLPILSLHYYLTPKWRISYFFLPPLSFIRCNQKLLIDLYSATNSVHNPTNYDTNDTYWRVIYLYNHHDRYITSKYCSHRKEWYKQDMTQWRNVWNASPQEKGGWRVKKKFWSQCTQVIILFYKSYRIPKRYCYISSNIV